MSPRSMVCVEDGEVDRLAFERAARSLPGVAFRMFTSGRQALAVLTSESTEPPPEVIFLDVNLPDLRGTEVLRQLRRNASFRTTPIVVVSGSKDPSGVRQLYEDGANAYLAKPMGFEELTEGYRLCLSFWLRCVSSVNARPC